MAVYHRVSTLDQDPELARAELAAWAQRNGTIAERIEESASGVWNERPGLQRLLDLARRGQIDVVACWKLDRFGRSALDVLSNIESLTGAGVRFVATSQGIDIKARGDAMGRLMLTVLAAVAEFERDLIRERTRLGMARAKAKGKAIGRPRVHRVTAEKVGELRAAGKSWATVARELKCTVSVARLRAREHQEAQEGKR